MAGRYHERTESTVVRIDYCKRIGIIVRFAGILPWIGGTRTSEYSIANITGALRFLAFTRFIPATITLQKE